MSSTKQARFSSSESLTPTAAEVGENLLPNGDFEQGSKNGWTAYQGSNVSVDAAKNGADTVITACPLCLYNLQKNGGSELPVVYFTELLAEALGVK